MRACAGGRVGGRRVGGRGVDVDGRRAGGLWGETVGWARGRPPTGIGISIVRWSCSEQLRYGPTEDTMRPNRPRPLDCGPSSRAG